LKAPELPIVIGQMGVDGAKANPKMKVFKDAQAAGAEPEEFRGTVAVVKTDAYWDTTAQAVFDKGWRENIDEWNTVGSDYPYHYLGSAKTMLQIGKGFGEAMIALREKK
jgi:alpha-galactosidase